MKSFTDLNSEQPPLRAKTARTDKREHKPATKVIVFQRLCVG